MRWLWLVAALLCGAARADAGYRVGDVCYATVLEAGEAACHQFVRAVANSGTTAYLYSCGLATEDPSVGGRARLRLDRSTLIAGTPTVTPLVVTLTFPDCDTADNPPTDADQVQATLAIWGLGLGLLAAVWGARQVFSWLYVGRRET